MYSGHQTSINTPGWGWMVRGERQVEVRVSCQNKTAELPGFSPVSTIYCSSQRKVETSARRILADP